MPRPQTYKVQLGEHSLELSIAGEEIRANGAEVDFSINRLSANSYAVILEGKPYLVTIESTEANKSVVSVDGNMEHVTVKNERDLLLEQHGMADGDKAVEKEIRAPMPGLVLDILVSEGQTVEAGNGLLVLEAMKMENEIRAATEGVISKVHAKPGAPVAKGDLLIELDLAE